MKFKKWKARLKVKVKSANFPTEYKRPKIYISQMLMIQINYLHIDPEKLLVRYK